MPALAITPGTAMLRRKARQAVFAGLAMAKVAFGKQLNVGFFVASEEQGDPDVLL